MGEEYYELPIVFACQTSISKGPQGKEKGYTVTKQANLSVKDDDCLYDKLVDFAKKQNVDLKNYYIHKMERYDHSGYSGKCDFHLLKKNDSENPRKEKVKDVLDALEVKRDASRGMVPSVSLGYYKVILKPLYSETKAVVR